MSSSRSLRQLLHRPHSRSSSTAPPPSNASPEISAPQARIIPAAPAAVSDPYPQGLKIVAEGINPLVDIVAIHGLNGHRDKTWTARNGVHWLRDLLPNDIPHARIFCWGYDANTHATSRVSRQYLYNHARTLISDLCRKRKLSNSMERPIIFVAHSLGGIVMKSALIYSDAARRGALEEHRSIKVSTYGVIFMGTPHQGGNGVQLGRLLVNVASLFMAANDRILKHLERDSEWLQQQLDHYGPISGDFMTKFAYEEYKTPTALGHSIMVVPRISAVVPGQADAEPIAIHADHINMVRYTSREDGGYNTISETLQIMVSAAPEDIRRRWEVERRVDEARLGGSDSAFLNGFSLPEIKQRRALNEWLDPTPASDTFDLIRSQRFKGSCKWIYQNRFFQLWLTEPSWRVCHMDGPPGYGKSTIVTKLIEDLQSNHPVAFFFCRVREARQGWKDIIRTWIWQLLEQRPQPELITGVYNIYASALGITTTPLSTYFKALIWLVSKLDTAFIFLDGMDENPELAELGDQGLTMHFYCLSKYAKVFTVSRPDPSVRYTIPTHRGGFIRLAIKDSFNREDIETFLADGINKLGWDEERSKWIHMKLVEGANGMFLWAKLMLQGGISASKNRGEDRFHPESGRFAGLVRGQTILQKLGCPGGNRLFSRWDRWANEDSFNGHYCTPITIAAFFDLVGVLQQQLDEGVPADDDLVFGITPFLYAVHGDASEAAKLLINKGADPAGISKAGYGAARYASRNCLSVLPVVLAIDGPWATQRDKDEGRTVFHNVVSTVGWHPFIVGRFLDLSNAEALDQLDFLGQTALHRVVNISTDKAVNIIRERLTGSADTGYGKDKNDRKILSSSLEEVFTPNTNTGIQTWAQAWREFFCSNDNNADLSDFPQRTPSLTNGDIRTLVRKIRAHILRELVLRKPKLNVQDRLGRTALHIAVNAAGADDEAEETISPAVTPHRPPTAKDNTHSKDDRKKLESPLEILLVAGADPFVRDSAGRLAVEIAIARRHWHSARLLFEAMRLKVNLSQNEEDNIQHLRLLLDETEIEQSSPSFESRQTKWMQRRVGFPKSYRDMAETAFILEKYLESIPSLQAYTSNLLNGVVRRILDCASYWGPSATSVDVSTSVAGSPRLSLSLKAGRVRKIELFLAAPHRGSPFEIERRRPRVLEMPVFMYYSSGDHPPPSYDCGGLYRYSGSRDDGLQRLGNQITFNDDQVLLRWVDPRDEDGDLAVSLSQEDARLSPPHVLGDWQLWEMQDTDFELDIWKQSWPLAETDSGNYGELRRRVKDWMENLKEGDTVVLKAAEGFSIQDVSKFSRFGVVFYSVV